jgi:hypothetical protein
LAEAGATIGAGPEAGGRLLGKVLTGPLKPPPGADPGLARTNDALKLGLTAPELSGPTAAGSVGRSIQKWSERSVSGRALAVINQRIMLENATKGIVNGAEATKRVGKALGDLVEQGPSYAMQPHKLEAARIFGEEVAPKILELRAGVLPEKVTAQLRAASTGDLSPDLALRTLRNARSALQRGSKEAVPSGALDALEKILATDDHVSFSSGTALRTGLLKTGAQGDAILGDRATALTRKFTDDLTSGMSAAYPEWDPLRPLYAAGAKATQLPAIKKLAATVPPARSAAITGPMRGEITGGAAGAAGPASAAEPPPTLGGSAPPPPAGALPGGTQSRLRQLGVPEAQIGQMSMEEANQTLAAAGPQTGTAADEAAYQASRLERVRTAGQFKQTSQAALENGRMRAGQPGQPIPAATPPPPAGRPAASFAYQEHPDWGGQPMYNVEAGHPLHGFSVTAETLGTQGIPVPPGGGARALAATTPPAPATVNGPDVEAIGHLKQIHEALKRRGTDPEFWARMYNAFELAAVGGAAVTRGPAAAAKTALAVEVIPGVLTWAAHNPTTTRLLTKGILSTDHGMQIAAFTRVMAAYEASKHGQEEPRMQPAHQPGPGTLAATPPPGPGQGR